MMRRRRANAYTLVELMVGLAMFSIIALALQSAIVLASKAIPDAKGANANQLAASRIADQITAELNFALSVTEMTATAVTFTVADRNNDAVPETIRYAWTGVAGAPLTRTYNGTSSNVLDDVRELSLAYDKRSVINPTTYTESAESQLYSATGGLLTQDFNIDASGWCGQYFVPTLPNNAVYWRITRARIWTERNSGSEGICRVQVRTATASGLPTTVVLDQSMLLESSMNSNYTATDVFFTNAAGLDPSNGACVVVRWIFDTDACDVMNKVLGSPLATGSKLVQTSNSGVSWSSNTLYSMPLQVWGKSSTRDPDTYSYYLTNARVLLRCGAQTAARVNTAARVYSEPQVTGP